MDFPCILATSCPRWPDFGQQIFEGMPIFTSCQEAVVPGQEWHNMDESSLSLSPLVMKSRIWQSPAMADVMTLQVKPGVTATRPATCYQSQQSAVWVCRAPLASSFVTNFWKTPCDDATMWRRFQKAAWHGLDGSVTQYKLTRKLVC